MTHPRLQRRTAKKSTWVQPGNQWFNLTSPAAERFAQSSHASITTPFGARRHAKPNFTTQLKGNLMKTLSTFLGFNPNWLTLMAKNKAIKSKPGAYENIIIIIIINYIGKKLLAIHFQFPPKKTPHVKLQRSRLEPFFGTHLAKQGNRGTWCFTFCWLNEFKSSKNTDVAPYLPLKGVHHAVFLNTTNHSAPKVMSLGYQRKVTKNQSTNTTWGAKYHMYNSTTSL